MARQALVLLDSTDTLLAYPSRSTVEPDQLEQPTSARVRVRTPAQDLQAAPGDAATVDSLSATVSADAAEGATTLTLGSSATPVRGRQYLVTTTTGAIFVVEAAKGGAGTTLYLREPLPMAVASTSTVTGFAVSHALTSAETAQKGEGLALWTITLSGGAQYTFAQQFRVVPRILRSTLTASSLTRGWPLVSTMRFSGDVDFTELLESVWENTLIPRLQARGINPDTVFSPEALEGVHARMCLHHLASMDTSRGDEFVARLARDADESMETALASKEFWVDAAEDASTRDEDAPPAPYRSVRWVR